MPPLTRCNCRKWSRAPRRTLWNIRWRFNFPSCSASSTISSWCRSWSAWPTRRAVAEVIERLWGGDETLIVISSDLSHFHPYREAQSIDRGTAEAILALDPHLDHEQACGATPVAGLLLAARKHGLTPELLDLRNSGDTAGDRARVVGYAAFAFYEDARRVH